MDKDTFRFVIITGMSGAGKTNFMQKLEDMGYYCVDNLPPVLIVRFADLCWKSTSSTRHVAVVTDIRGGSFFDALPQALDELEKRGIPHEVVFLEASDEALVRRYMETRRQHPLAKNMRIQEGIEQERKILAGVRAQADMIIDTTSMQASDLKEYMQSRFSADSTDQEMQITVFSFGFKYGIPIDADMVIGVPNSSLSAASGYAEEAGLPNEMGLIKNQYVARTFIQPTQELREQGVRMKLSAVRGVVKGKRVIVIDDSIVRGTTSKRIVQLLKEAGAAEVHMRISSPPLKYPCFYGIDISTTKELIAAKKSVEEIREYIGADSLAFLSLDGLVESIGLGADAPYGGLCVAYFNGDYPTALDDYEADFLKSLPPEDRVRLPEFALYKSKYEGNEYTTTSPQEEH